MDNDAVEVTREYMAEKWRSFNEKWPQGVLEADGMSQVPHDLQAHNGFRVAYPCDEGRLDWEWLFSYGLLDPARLSGFEGLWLPDEMILGMLKAPNPLTKPHK